jgi:isopentenyldiphosphate isomerase
LLAQRSFSKKNNPGKWGPTVVGTVEEGETYEDNIIKETFEEIGLEIDPAELTKGSKERREGEANDYFRQWYLLTIDKEIEDFTIQKSEVENLQWFDKIALAKSVKEKPEMFMQSVKQWVELSFKDEN